MKIAGYFNIRITGNNIRVDEISRELKVNPSHSYQKDDKCTVRNNEVIFLIRENIGMTTKYAINIFNYKKSKSKHIRQLHDEITKQGYGYQEIGSSRHNCNDR